MIDERRGVDVLVIGGLAVDRIGPAIVAGGSVLYASEAAAAAGLHVAAATVAGSEPAAVEGIRRLRAVCERVEVAAAPQTTRFLHEYRGVDRLLTLEARAAPLTLSEGLVETMASWAPRAVLVAPIADEVPGDLAAAAAEIAPGAYTAASIQGWLRRPAADGRVEPIELADVDPSVRRAAAGYRLVVASQEDLAAEGLDADARLDRLRAWSGPRPDVIVTLGVEGAILDAGGDRRTIRPPRVIPDVPTVGAGDAFAAVVAGERGAGRPLEAASERAAEIVARLLEGRQAT